MKKNKVCIFQFSDPHVFEMDRGTDAMAVLLGEIIPVKLGIIGVVNRSQADIDANKPIDACVTDEMSFLYKNYSTFADKNGNLAKTMLAYRLSIFLVLQNFLLEINYLILRDAMAVLMGEIIPVKLGIIGVVHRLQAHIKAIKIYKNVYCRLCGDNEMLRIYGTLRKMFYKK